MKTITLLLLALATMLGLSSCHALHHAAHDVEGALFHGGGHGHHHSSRHSHCY